MNKNKSTARDRYEYKNIPPFNHLGFWDNETSSEMSPELVAMTLNGQNKKLELMFKKLQELVGADPQTQRRLTDIESLIKEKKKEV